MFNLEHNTAGMLYQSQPNQEKAIASGTPLGRVGKPEDVADVIVFLASEQAHWLTGQMQYVGDGWRMGQ